MGLDQAWGSLFNFLLRNEVGPPDQAWCSMFGFLLQDGFQYRDEAVGPDFWVGCFVSLRLMILVAVLDVVQY